MCEENSTWLAASLGMPAPSRQACLHRRAAWLTLAGVTLARSSTDFSTINPTNRTLRTVPRHHREKIARKTSRPQAKCEWVDDMRTCIGTYSENLNTAWLLQEGTVRDGTAAANLVDARPAIQSCAYAVCGLRVVGCRV
mgnify:CR=1 FL=1